MNTPSSPLSQELEMLVTALCDDSLLDSGLRRLEELVLADTSLRREYIQRLNLHASLGWNRADTDTTVGLAGTGSELSTGAESSAPPRLSAALRPATPTRASIARSILVVAAVFYGVFALIASKLPTLIGPAVNGNDGQFVSGNTGTASSNAIAKLISAEHCRWGEPASTIAVGTGLAAQRLRLESGTAELEFRSGVRAILHGPCTFMLKSPNAGFLAAGRIDASVPASAIGFAVDTPSARVIDRGTKFGVEVHASGDTDVHVFQGRVDVAAAAGDAKEQRQRQAATGRRSGSRRNGIEERRADCHCEGWQLDQRNRFDIERTSPPVPSHKVHRPDAQCGRHRVFTERLPDTRRHRRRSEYLYAHARNQRRELVAGRSGANRRPGGLGALQPH